MWVRPAYLASGLALLGWLAAGAVGAQPADLLRSQLALGQDLPAPREDRPAQHTLVDVMTRLEDRFQVSFVYANQLVRGRHTQLSGQEDGTLDQLLAQLLPPLNLTYQRHQNTVVLMKAGSATGEPAAKVDPAAALAALTIRQQPGRTISGRITDGSGQPLVGATIQVIEPGTGRTLAGGYTDDTGAFAINTTATGEVQLQISYIGFQPRQITVSGADAGTLQLTASDRFLDDVVVIGYGTQTQRQLTTSVSSVGAEEISKAPVAGFDLAIQGRATGVQVTAATGQPGAAPNIRIRGNTSVQLNNSPLFVVDGVPILPDYNTSSEINGDYGEQRTNPLNNINPADIESIDILKDAAAAAIYGVRAANGVVVITTKRGQAGKARVNVEGYYGFQRVINTLDVLDGPGFARLLNDIRVNGEQPPAYATPGSVPTVTDWQDAIFRDASIYNLQASVSGGSDRTQYYISGALFDQEGTIENSGFRRYNMRLNLDQTSGERFRFGVNLNLSRTDNNRSVTTERGAGNSGVLTGALAGLPDQPLFTPAGAYTLNQFSGNFPNALALLRERSNLAEIYQALTNVYGEYTILSGLRLRTSVGLDFRSQTEREFQSTRYPNSTGRGTAANQRFISWLWETTLTYDKSWGDHNFTFLGGYSAQDFDRYSSGTSRVDYASSTVPYVSAGATINTSYDFREEYGLTSFFLRTIYNYKDRYFATISARNDASSKFSDGNRSQWFPAVSLGWRLSNEDWFPEVAVLSDLKLRASWAQVGNEAIFAYDRFSRFSPGQNYPNLGGGISPGFNQSTIGNQNITWETTQQVNLGLDISLWESRLALSLDWYDKRTTDLLFRRPLPPSAIGAPAGEAVVIENSGEVRNRGFEIGINAEVFRPEGDGFGWTSNFNLSLNRNELVDYGAITEGNQLINGNNVLRTGEPLGVFYGFVYDGVFQEDQTASSTQPQARAGDARFRDLNGDGVLTADDRTIIGDPNPDFIAGWNNTFTYKNFELSVFFQGSFGNDIYNQLRADFESMSDPINQLASTANRWRPDNRNTNMPRAVAGDPNQNTRFSSRFVEDGTYIRLRNLTLGYRLPQSVLRRLNLESCRVFVTGQNLITITDYSGYDPEVSSQPFNPLGFGVDAGTYPQARTYTVGLSLGF